MSNDFSRFPQPERKILEDFVASQRIERPRFAAVRPVPPPAALLAACERALAGSAGLRAKFRDARSMAGDHLTRNPHLAGGV